MERVFRFFVENYRFSLIVSLFIFLTGGLGLLKMNRETFPPVDFARATITTIYPGSSPEEVEEKITKKIEDEIRSVDGIKDVKSISQSGRSEIQVRIDMDNVKVKDVMDELQRAVQRVSSLPADILEQPKFDQVNSKEIPVIELALVGGDNDTRERDEMADELKTQLEDVRGVSSVRLAGFRNREFQILLNRERLAAYHVGITEVLAAVQRRSLDIPAGYVRTDENQKLVRVRGQIRTAEEMGRIAVRSNFAGPEVLVRDVAQVIDGAEEASVLARINGEPATLLTVAKKANADAVTTVERLQGHLAEFNKRLPEGYRIVVYNNEAERIADRLAIVVGNAVSGLVLVLIVLLIFLPGILGVMTALSLPMAVFGTVGILAYMGVNFNTITMLAFVIAIGMLVDNAVVISENYAQIRARGWAAAQAAIKAGHQFWKPITATALTTMAAFLPMLVTKGVMGQFIRYIPIVVTVALLVSLLESFFLLPARLQFVMRRAKHDDSPSVRQNWFDGVVVWFEKFTALCVRRRYLVTGLMGAGLVASLLLAVFGNRFELFPQEDVEYYYARFEAPVTSPLSKTERLAQELEQKIRSVLDEDTIKYMVTRVGVSQLGPGDVQAKNGDNVGMVIIAVPREKARELRLQDVLRNLRTIDRSGFDVLTFEGRAGGPPVGKPVTVTFRANNSDHLRSVADRIKEGLARIDGVMDVADDEVVGGEEYNVRLDFNLLSRLNLSVQEVGAALRTALQGTIASELNLNNEEFDLRIRYADSGRGTVEALQGTRLMEAGSMARMVPLSSIASIEPGPGPTIRRHMDYLRSITVTADVNPEKITSIEANRRVALIFDSLKSEFPSVTAVYGGEQESTKESMQSLMSAMVLALFGIFMILVFLFNSFMKPLLVLTTVFLGLIGVFVAFFLHQKPLGFFAMIGVVGLAGVVVNSAIVLISFIDELRAESTLGLHEILARASALRLRAVLVTSLTTIGGLLPTAYGIGGYDPVLVPMTLALAWGLTSGTLMTLIWIPCVYAIAEDALGMIRALLSRWRPQEVTT